MSTILITGGTGLIGRQLSKRLLSSGHSVRILSRHPKSNGDISSFFWDVDAQKMDEKALDGVDHIVHLAGAGVADKRWTAPRRKEIIDSRVNSMKLITDTVKRKNIHLKSVVGASAIGIYGMITSEKIYEETDPGRPDFLSEVCQIWEKSYEDIREHSEKTAIIRISVVLSEKGGALKRLVPLFKMGLGSAIGHGKQYMPWIHLDDLVSIFEKALFDPSYEGIYNAVATEHMTSNQFSEQLAKSLSKPYIMPNVPAFALKLLYGTMANVLLEGVRVSNQKLLDRGFRFKYPGITEALRAIAKPEHAT